MQNNTKKYIVFFTLLGILSGILVYLPTSKTKASLKEQAESNHGGHEGHDHEQMHIALDEALRLVEQNPMQGIQKLVAVSETYPNEYEPVLMLGIFSYQTNQFEKASKRFEKVLNLLPSETYNEDVAQSYAYLDVCYIQQGLKEKSDSILNVWRDVVPESDTAVIKRIASRLEENRTLGN